MLCRDGRLAALGVAARRARQREGPVIVSASNIASWYWCPLKAWHDTTLFNTGWLSRREVIEHLDALASLWAVELTRSQKPAVRRGRRIHGEYVAVELELLDPCEIVYSGVYGLINPVEYREQVRRLEAARDPVDYYKRERWPLFRYVAHGFELLGVPDGIERGDNGFIVVELKSTSNLERFMSGPGVEAAKHQLAAYVLMLETKWHVEKAVLLVTDKRGRIVRRLEWRPSDLQDAIRDVERIAAKLASVKLPWSDSSEYCRYCEYKLSRLVRCEKYDALDYEPLRP